MYTNMTTNLMVQSVDKAITFYTEILEFSVLTSVPGKNNELQFAILTKDNLMIMVQEKNNFIEEYPVLNTKKIHASVSLYITVDNLDELYDNIQAQHPINTEIHTSFYGMREFAITDVDGYVLTFAEHNEN